MTSTDTAPVRATCPKCLTPDLIVNPSGSLRKHECVPADAPPAGAEAPPAAGEATADPGPAEAPADAAVDSGGEGGASSFGTDATADGGTAGAPEPAAEPVEVIEESRYCAHENCGRRPVRHGLCGNHHATDCGH